MPRSTSSRKRSRSATKKSPQAVGSATIKNRLSASFVDDLIGRDDEYKELYDTIKNGLINHASTTIYISGPAGTGKTLTTNTVVNDLIKNHRFKLISINCMSFQNALDFYEKILAKFEPTKSKTKRACVSTTTFKNQVQAFTELKDTISSAKIMTVIILDEIDQLQTKNYDLLNNLFRLATLLTDKVILVGIANALDFTAKIPWLKNEKTMNFHPFRFLPYKQEQIVRIIETRLKMNTDHENVLIDRNAIEFCARKIASSSGDIRKALDVCRRAIELIDNLTTNPLSKPCKTVSPLTSKENFNKSSLKNDCVVKKQKVDIILMMEVLNKVYGNAVDKLRTGINGKVFLPSDQQVILCVFLILLKIKSQKEIKLQDFHDVMLKICKHNGITTEGKSEPDIMAMCQYLADYGYVMVQKKNSNQTRMMMRASSPFKRTPNKSSSATITLQLLIEPSQAEQLLTSFHRSILADAYSYIL